MTPQVYIIEKHTVNAPPEKVRNAVRQTRISARQKCRELQAQAKQAGEQATFRERWVRP